MTHWTCVDWRTIPDLPDDELADYAAQVERYNALRPWEQHETSYNAQYLRQRIPQEVDRRARLAREAGR